MLDPPPDAQNADRSIALSTGSFHLRRVCRISVDQSSDPKCEYILLLSNTRFGRTDGVNHVVLSCPDSLNILDCHAVIRSDQLDGNIRRYELLAHKGAPVYINGYQIESEKFRPLCPGDRIEFGDKLSESNGFIFQFEPANNQFDYSVIRQNLRPNSLTTKTLTIFNDSLAFKVGTLRTTLEDVSLAEPAPQFHYEKSIQPELILNILKASRQQLNISAKENMLMDYCPSIPIIANKIAASAVHDFVEVRGGQTIHSSPLNIQQPVYKVQLPTKFDIDLIEVAKRIASRIVNHDQCDDDQSVDEFDQQNNNVEKSQLQMPLIASVTNLSVYPCNTSLTSASSISPPPYADFQHASETSSSSTSFNHSDSGHFSANESGHSNFNTSNTNQLSSVCVKDKEECNLDEKHVNKTNEEQVNKTSEEQKNVGQSKSSKSDSQQSLPKSSSAARLEMLAALASSSNSQSFEEELEQTPLEIFIPLATCSDRDDSLSPAQTVKSEKILSPTSTTPHRLGKLRSSRQSTHDADDSHIHTTKQLKTQAGIEVCRRRMLKYIANNLYTAQISKRFQAEPAPMVLKPQKEEEQPVVELEAEPEVPKIEKPNVEYEVPKPLNLYPDGEEYVAKNGKQRRNSKKQTLAEAVTDAEQHLFATLLLSIRAPKAPPTNESSHSSASNSLNNSIMNEELVFEERSEDKSEADLKAEVSAEEPMEIDREESIEVRVKPVGPSHEEEQLLLEAERKIPKLTGIGRHTMNKFRLLYRADLDRSSPATIPTQHHRLIEKCRENRLRFEEKQKQVQKKLQMAGKRRMAKRSSDPLGSPIARMPIIKKSSNPSKIQNACGQKRQSTDFSSLSIHQLAKDPNFDGFLADEYGAGKKTDPFHFNEEEDQFSLKKNPTPQNQRPFFATENARSAAINANVSIHNQQHKKSRKRQQSGQPSADTPTKQKGRRNSSTPKAKRGRIAGRGPGRKPRKSAVEKEEEPCASINCCPKNLASASGVIEWIACDTCLAWFHCYCVLGINRPVADDENFQCHRCQQS